MLLVRAGEMFHQSLDVEDTLNNVARMAVEAFADLCLFDLVDEDSDRLYVTAGAHRDSSVDAALKSVGSSILYTSGPRRHPAVEVTMTGRSFFLPVLNEQVIAQHAVSPQHADFMRRMRYRSKIVVPVTAQSHLFGALTFVRTDETAPFDGRDVQAAEELGRRAGVAVANAKQYHREQHVATTLQRAFLTREFPIRSDLLFHAIYRPGKGDAELGGDWYDAFQTANGSIIVTIGDVTGKGVEAARLMVQLRQSVRVAATVTDDPAAMMRIVNDALLFDRTGSFATAFIGIISTDSKLLRYASAGHPPAFIRWDRDGVERLSSGSPLLGISSEIEFESHATRIEEGALLVLYTDGLTEATRDVIAGEDRLCEVLATEASLHAANPARFIERTIADLNPRDDVAILTVRFGIAKPYWRFDVGEAAAAYSVKRDLMDAIANLCEDSPEALHACEMIVAELIGNAVRHAPGPLSLSLSQEHGAVVLHVIDEGRGFDYHPSLPPDTWAESGRGLFLISMLAPSIRVTRLPGYGSHIRVVLPLSSRCALEPEKIVV